MAARFTLASGLTSKVNAFSAYLSTFSKRSLSLLALFTITISVIFLYSSHSPNFLSTTPDGFRFGRNESHLLSPGVYDCGHKCLRPKVEQLEPKQIWEACLDPGVVPEYYLSVVMVSRNDNYGGEQFHRLQNAIDSTFLMAEETKTPIELLLIEWNPPVGRRRIRDVYRFRRSAYLTYRIITVSREIHESLHGRDDGSSIYEFEGKNVGIRFARGEFIVCTNQDDIWSANMYNAIISRVWRKKVFYTQFQDSHIPYQNLPSTLVKLTNFATDDQIVEACPHDRYERGHFTLTPHKELDTNNFLEITNEASDFTLAHRDTWKMTHGYRETGAKSWMDMELLLTASWTLKIPINYSPEPFTCHQQHEKVHHPNSEKDNQGVDVGRMMRGEEINMNNKDEWGLQNIDLWSNNLQCEVFRGGIGM
ncbi:hypothetical protein LRAMOSA08677 [Lichtheimia ramosa]|uniref:Uncharacterized protein n=1 Tax=Lichtheimia ramosa TaxID=688394 RepID=A0A077WG51_9FUNG|nr:hypothetical protein LRAMOSA08677 [Lichtheimia ramosa]